MRNLSTQLFFIVIVLFMNWYVFQGLKTIGLNWSPKNRLLVFGAYWLIAAAVLIFFFSFLFVPIQSLGKGIRALLFAIAMGFVFGQFVASIFLMADDLRRLVLWFVQLFTRWQPNNLAAGSQDESAIPRSVFLSWLGIGLGGTLFGSFVYGLSNKYNYKVRTINLSFPNLPKAFQGFKIVQISDIHSGSFGNPAKVLEGINLINQQHADLILFTGDLVNDRAVEMEPYKDLFSKISAKMGVYSTLGNHDYGDYYKWESQADKEANLKHLIQIHQQLGWQLLMDQQVNLTKDGESIGLIGVQNISGKGRFHSYGSMAKAVAQQPTQPFNILMSHDPSHWEAEILPKYKHIDLTLSGHTHGMQFGVEIPGFKWSPVQWMYKQWAGLYEEGPQKLYVNRGFGFIGYQGRVGIMPEITVIELS